MFYANFRYSVFSCITVKYQSSDNISHTIETCTFWTGKAPKGKSNWCQMSTIFRSLTRHQIRANGQIQQPGGPALLVKHLLLLCVCRTNADLQAPDEKYQQVVLVQLLLSSFALHVSYVQCTSKHFGTSCFHMKNFLFVSSVCSWSWSPNLLVQSRRGHIFISPDTNWVSASCENVKICFSHAIGTDILGAS